MQGWQIISAATVEGSAMCNLHGLILMDCGMLSYVVVRQRLPQHDQNTGNMTLQEYAPGHPHIATALAHMSEALRLQGRTEEAAATAQRALDAAEAAYGSMAPAVAEVLMTLGQLRAAQGDMAAGEAALRR